MAILAITYRPSIFLRLKFGEVVDGPKACIVWYAIVGYRYLDLKIQMSLEASKVVLSPKPLACFSVGSPVLAIKVPVSLGGPLDPQSLGPSNWVAKGYLGTCRELSTPVMQLTDKICRIFAIALKDS